MGRQFYPFNLNNCQCTQQKRLWFTPQGKLTTHTSLKFPSQKPNTQGSTCLTYQTGSPGGAPQGGGGGGGGIVPPTFGYNTQGCLTAVGNRCGHKKYLGMSPPPPPPQQMLIQNLIYQTDSTCLQSPTYQTGSTCLQNPTYQTGLK